MIKEGIRGFTVIEALIVIGVVGALASTVLLATEQSRLKSQEIRIRVDLTQARSAISLLLYDTGKWPNGCEPEKVSNPEVAINTAQSGIVKKPNVGDQGNDCKWTQNDINNWDGGYIVIGVEEESGVAKLPPIGLKPEQLDAIQKKLIEGGDEEAMMPDDEFVEMLEHGMRPAYGLGMGERFFAFLVDKPLRETQLFPLMRPRE